VSQYSSLISGQHCFVALQRGKKSSANLLSVVQFDAVSK